MDLGLIKIKLVESVSEKHFNFEHKHQISYETNVQIWSLTQLF